MSAQRLFIWQGIDNKGHLHQGEVVAKDRQFARQQLLTQGYYPIKLTLKAQLRKKCWRPAARVAFTRQLATLLHAGLPLVNSLQIIARQHESAAWRYLLGQLQQHVAQGLPLSSGLAAHPHVFPPLYRQLITTGELTGQLDRCCLQLAQQQERVMQIRKKVHQSLRYPLFVLIVALLVTLLMLLFVLPEFATIYQSFEAPLPWFTQWLLQSSATIQNGGGYFLLFGTIAIGSYWRFLHPQPLWQSREQRCLLSLPLLNPLLSTSALSRIFRTLAMTQATGIPLLAGLQAAKEIAGHLFYTQALHEIQQQVSQGVALQDAFYQQPLFPPLAQQLIRVGEESGMLEEMLTKLAVSYEQQAEELATKLSQALEPIMMLVIGGIVGTLVIAMYLPIFQLGNVIS